MLTIGEINLITTVLWYQYKEVLKEYERANKPIIGDEFEQVKTLPALIGDKLKSCINKLNLDQLQNDINEYISQFEEKITPYTKSFKGIYGNGTYLTDCLNNNLHIGDVIISKFNYMVVVDGDEEDYIGRLVTDDPNNTCKDIPYSLGDGSDYKLYKGYDKINNEEDLMKVYHEWANK
jgi:hypothetical protein